MIESTVSWGFVVPMIIIAFFLGSAVEQIIQACKETRRARKEFDRAREEAKRIRTAT